MLHNNCISIQGLTLVILLFITPLSFGLELEENTSEEQFLLKALDSNNSSLTTNRVPKKIKRTPGNMPSYARRSNLKGTKATPKGSILPKNKVLKEHKELKVGDIVPAIVIENLKAVLGEALPIKASVTAGKFKGSTLVGTYKLNPKTRKASAVFSLLRDSVTNKTYKLTAVALGRGGEEGIGGQFINHRGKTFWARVLSNFISGASQGSIRYEKNAFGSFEKTPGISNAAREGVAEASKQAAKDYEREIEREPVYIEAKGPIEISLFITEQPYLAK